MKQMILSLVLSLPCLVSADELERWYNASGEMVAVQMREEAPNKEKFVPAWVERERARDARESTASRFRSTRRSRFQRWGRNNFRCGFGAWGGGYGFGFGVPVWSQRMRYGYGSGVRCYPVAPCPVPYRSR